MRVAVFRTITLAVGVPSPLCFFRAYLGERVGVGYRGSKVSAVVFLPPLPPVNA